MSAQLIYDTAPLGSLIRYSNGEPRPPERFTRKLKAWNNDNGIGRLIERSAEERHLVAIGLLLAALPLASYQRLA